MNKITNSKNNSNEMNKELIKKFAMIGMDKESIKRRNAFVGEARKIYADPKNKNILIVKEK